MIKIHQFDYAMNNKGTIVINEKNMRIFFQYINTRHTMYKKRFLEHAPPPWTADPILQRYKFTNVFRDLDPGTQYVKQKIIPNVHSPEEIIFNIFIYRMYNRRQTYDRIGLQYVDTFNKTTLESILRKIKDSGEPVFTNAFTVCGYHFINPKADKISNTCTIIEHIHANIEEITNRILEHKDSQYTYECLLEQQGIGTFLAYQLALDLGYWDHNIFNESAFVVAGPGCKKGVDRLFLAKAHLHYEDLIVYLCALQNDWFHNLNIDPEKLFSDREEKQLNVMAMENCLCEISKYLRVYYGTGRPKNLYRPATLE